MSETVEIVLDDAGRITLPAPLSHRLGLTPGMTFVAEPADDGGLRLQAHPGLVREGTVLVIQGEARADLNDFVRQAREERLDSLTPLKG